MKFLWKIIDFYIESSLHVSLSVISFCLITIMEFGIKPDFHLLIFIFFSSLTGYNFIKYTLPSVGNFKKQNSKKLLFLGLSITGLLFFAFHVSQRIIILSTVFGFFTFFYATPLIKNKNLRMLPGLKIFIVAFVWSGVTVLMPLINDIADLNWDVWLTFFQRMMLVVVLIIPFELRDMNRDLVQLKTLPRQIGIQKTKIAGWFLLILILFIELLKPIGKTPYFFSLLIFVFLLGVTLKKTKTNQNRYFSSFGVEALPIIWLVIFIIATQL